MTRFEHRLRSSIYLLQLAVVGQTRHVHDQANPILPQKTGELAQIHLFRRHFFGSSCVESPPDFPVEERLSSARSASRRFDPTPVRCRWRRQIRDSQSSVGCAYEPLEEGEASEGLR
jgi:hypothetical protein